MTQDYYSQRLSADRLRRVYEIAPPRVRQYLDSEIDYILKRINRGDRTLELGCGYGRALTRLKEKAAFVAGIDTSITSVTMALSALGGKRTRVLCMDAAHLGFGEHSFDAVVCIQNGISAFHRDRRTLIREAVRVTRTGGVAMFSSYSDAFWDERLNWFELQSREGLLGEIDYDLTGDGTIVCKDGFKAATIREKEFMELTADLGLAVEIKEIDCSSLFCVIHV